MIIPLEATTISRVSKALVRIREQGGVAALGRVLTLVVFAPEDRSEAAIRAANLASGEHPMRVVVVHTNTDRGADARLDAEVRIGGDAAATDVVVLHPVGPLVDDPESLVRGLLLPDAPVVVWWADGPVLAPSSAPLGATAQLRIIDTHGDACGRRDLAELSRRFRPGDVNLAWTRLLRWRGQLAAVLDLPPYEEIDSARVVGAPGAATAIFMAAWLGLYLDVPVDLDENASWRDAEHADLFSVELRRPSGVIRLERLDDATVRLSQPGAPAHTLPLPVPDATALLAEELARMSTDAV